MVFSFPVACDTLKTLKTINIDQCSSVQQSIHKEPGRYNEIQSFKRLSIDISFGLHLFINVVHVCKIICLVMNF
ncbi:hypothetical protein XELAEV_18020509mg [Xenopus laevis]|uniref:Uncharacterized protein n=1 Tax=Xenopus laevis TaxID=8355 RepID=A0A974D7H2_XENLA|nr:hypothetical protein XELAEV_18020509mg [Xenopus laevis]